MPPKNELKNWKGREMADPDLFKQAADSGPSWSVIAGWASTATGAVAAVFAWLFQRAIKKHDEEILGLHTAIGKKADNDDLRDHMARSEKARDELRESQKLLFTKVDSLRDHVDGKFDKLADLIRSQK